MNKIFLLILGLIFIISGCVDDYTEANPPTKLDAPALRFSSSAASQKTITVPVNAYQKNYTVYTQYGQPTEFTVSVIDAPGRVSSVSVQPSVPDFGTVALDEASVASLTGQAAGSFKFTFTPNPALPDEQDRALNLVITVSDSQLNQNGEAGPKTTTLTISTNIVSCLSEELQEGTYVVTAASGNLDGGVAYTLDDLKADGGVEEILVTITKDRPGLYTFDEVTGGCFPVYYGGRANPALQVDLCGTVIQGHEGSVTAGSPPGPLRKFTIDGMLNADRTISVTWSYERVDAASPNDPAKGTYTLARQD